MQRQPFTGREIVEALKTIAGCPHNTTGFDGRLRVHFKVCHKNRRSSSYEAGFETLAGVRLGLGGFIEELRPGEATEMICMAFHATPSDNTPEGALLEMPKGPDRADGHREWSREAVAVLAALSDVAALVRDGGVDVDVDARVDVLVEATESLRAKHLAATRDGEAEEQTNVLRP